MKKIKYYFINKKNEFQLARTSSNTYLFAIVYDFGSEERAIMCSKNKQSLIKKVNYMTGGFVARECGLSLNKYYSGQFYEPVKIRIVPLSMGV